MKINFLLMISIVSIICFSSTVYAYTPQCNNLSLKQIAKAEKVFSEFLKNKEIAIIDRFCEFCTDKYPRPIKIESIQFIKNSHKKSSRYLANSGDNNQILVNNKQIDAAYIFIDGDNLASILECDTFGVSAYLD